MDNMMTPFVKMTERELVNCTLNGSEQAYDEIVRRYYKRLYQTAEVILKDPALADSVTRETFMHARSIFHQYQYQSLLVVWLVRIVVEKAREKRGLV
jgi:RNA polymerase sigma-70 factor (ECF subfamily)